MRTESDDGDGGVSDEGSDVVETGHVISEETEGPESSMRKTIAMFLAEETENVCAEVMCDCDGCENEHFRGDVEVVCR